MQASHRHGWPQQTGPPGPPASRQFEQMGNQTVLSESQHEHKNQPKGQEASRAPLSEAAAANPSKRYGVHETTLPSLGRHGISELAATQRLWTHHM